MRTKQEVLLRAPEGSHTVNSTRSAGSTRLPEWTKEQLESSLGVHIQDQSMSSTCTLCVPTYQQATGWSPHSCHTYGKQSESNLISIFHCFMRLVK